MINTSKTIGPLHFEDLEDLVRQLIYNPKFEDRVRFFPDSFPSGEAEKTDESPKFAGLAYRWTGRVARLQV